MFLTLLQWERARCTAARGFRVVQWGRLCRTRCMQGALAQRKLTAPEVV